MRFLFIFLISFFLLAGMASSFGFFQKEKSPDEIIRNLEKGIIDAEKRGEYKCCIAPSCKMCYIGNWHFDKGTCYCDDMIAEGKMDEVCPECKNNLKDNICENDV